MSSIAHRRSGNWGFISALGVCLVILAGWAAVASAEVDIDIRSGGNLREVQNEVAYLAAINDCTDVIAIDVSAGDNRMTVSPSEAGRTAGTPTGCELGFTATGVGRYNPQVTLQLADGATRTHNEHFAAEKNAPQLKFEAVRLGMAEGRQYLVVTAGASDDVDINYVGFDVTGLRASDLRAAGGVVARAREQAFAALILSCTGIFIFPLAIIGIVLGHAALNRCNEDASLGGRGLAKTALIVGYGFLSLVIICVLLFLFVPTGR